MKKVLTIIFVCFVQSSFFAQNLQTIDAANVSYEIEAFAPGKTYIYDIGEKDLFYHKSDSILVFTKVKIESSESTRKGLRLKFTFIDKVGNEIVCDATDVKKLIPKLECNGEMLYAEILSEEFNFFMESSRINARAFFMNKIRQELPELIVFLYLHDF